MKCYKEIFPNRTSNWQHSLIDWIQSKSFLLDLELGKRIDEKPTRNNNGVWDTTKMPLAIVLPVLYSANDQNKPGRPSKTEFLNIRIFKNLGKQNKQNVVVKMYENEWNFIFWQKGINSIEKEWKCCKKK